VGAVRCASKYCFGCRRHLTETRRPAPDPGRGQTFQVMRELPLWVWNRDAELADLAGAADERNEQGPGFGALDARAP